MGWPLDDKVQIAPVVPCKHQHIFEEDACDADDVVSGTMANALTGMHLSFRIRRLVMKDGKELEAVVMAGRRAAPVKVTPLDTTVVFFKITPLDTTVVFFKIPEAFISQEQWKQARTNPARYAASWSASHKVVLADTWGWVAESPAKAGQQLYGTARVASKELTSLLGVSGQGGVFVDALRHAVATQVQWLAPSTGESSLAYHERGLRMGSKLGIVTQ
ncbi:unnamed protein product [Symbiodinium sp. KB8]|nr:unnamed protein product [Symbiodinium sp. KB8]